MMSTPASFLVLCGIAILFFLTARTLVREVRTGVPHLLFSPHPAYRNRPVNRRSAFLWFSVVLRIFGTVGLSLMVIVAVAFLLGSLGVIHQ
jgi:hypothetical protein